MIVKSSRSLASKKDSYEVFTQTQQGYQECENEQLYTHPQRTFQFLYLFFFLFFSSC